MTDQTRPYLEHAPRCQRRRPPVLVAGWGAHDPGRVLCPECGRSVAAPDARPPRPPTPTDPERTNQP